MKTSSQNRIAEIIDYTTHQISVEKSSLNKILVNLEEKEFDTIEQIKEILKSQTGLEINLYVWEDDREVDEKIEFPDIRLDGEFIIDELEEEYEEFSLWYYNKNGKMLITETTGI